MAGNDRKPIDKGNLSERVYANIRSALMDGEYQPGERLRINALAEQLGVSITPVREAIFRLVSDHVLEMKAATAIHVPELSADELREIQLIRLLLEGEAAGLAAERITAKELAALEDLQAHFQKAVASDPKKAALLNREFHFGLIAAARMPLIFNTVENMWVLMGPLLRTFHMEMPKRDLASGDHKHFDVLQGLRTRDAAMTRQAIQDDIRWSKVMIDWAEKRAATPA